MGAIVSFFTVAGAIMILVPLALGMELIVFLDKYIWEASLIFWMVVIAFCFFLGHKEENKHDKWFIYTGWSSLLPVYCFLVGAVKEILTMRGFNVILAVLIELPLCVCFSLAGGLGISFMAEKIKEPVLEVSLMLAGNILLTIFVTSFGL